MSNDKLSCLGMLRPSQAPTLRDRRQRRARGGGGWHTMGRSAAAKGRQLMDAPSPGRAPVGAQSVPNVSHMGSLGLIDLERHVAHLQALLAQMQLDSWRRSRAVRSAPKAEQ